MIPFDRISKFPQKCSNTTTLLLAIKSEVKNFERREAIRKSWGNDKHFADYETKLIFLVADLRVTENLNGKFL